METIQPPPPPQRTGNAQVDAYLRRIYEWAYLLWYYQTGAGIQDPSITGSTGALLTAPGIPGFDGEDGEDGLTIIGPQGARGLQGRTIPGMDGQDGEDAFSIGATTGLFDPYGAAAAAQAASQPLDADLTAIAALVSSADKVPYSTGAGTWALAALTAAGRALIDDATAAAQATTLGLGTTDSPVFVTAKLTGLTDLKVPKHVDDATGLADTTITVSANNEVTNASQPAFLATFAGTTNVTGDGTAYTVPYATEVFDQNADYNNGTYTFTAPVTGRYQLQASISMYGLTVNHNDHRFAIVTSNRSYDVIDIFAAGANPFAQRSLHISVLADMDAADTAYVTLTVSGSTKVVDLENAIRCQFSGSLAC